MNDLGGTYTNGAPTTDDKLAPGQLVLVCLRATRPQSLTAAELWSLTRVPWGEFKGDVNELARQKLVTRIDNDTFLNLRNLYFNDRAASRRPWRLYLPYLSLQQWDLLLKLEAMVAEDRWILTEKGDQLADGLWGTLSARQKAAITAKLSGYKVCGAVRAFRTRQFSAEFEPERGSNHGRPGK